MKKKYGIFSIVIILCAFLFITALVRIERSPFLSLEPKLHADVYPLYPAVVWGDAYEKLFTDIKGHEIASVPITNITDLSSVFIPFDNYYSKKLAALGWKEDQSLAAGGPGSSLTAYRKGDYYVLFGYSTVFHGAAKNEPVQCPCDITMTVFSGRI